MAVATVDDYQKLVEALGADPETRDADPLLCLDVGHLFVTREGAPEEVIPRVKDRLAQVHLEDMRTGVHEHLLPGQGDVDFAAVRNALQEAEYAGAVCFELSRHSHEAPTAARRAFEFLKPILTNPGSTHSTP